MSFFSTLFNPSDLPRPADGVDPDLNYLAKIVNDWLTSPERLEQIKSDEYYRGSQDILNRKRTVIGRDGQIEAVTNLPNNRIVDNQYRKLVDQQTNYCLGKPLIISTSNDEYLNRLLEVFDDDIYDQLSMLATYSIQGGIGWLHPYYDEEGVFQIAVFPAQDVCAIWRDKSHTKLELALRYYEENIYNPQHGMETLKRIDAYTKDGIDHYILQGLGLKKAPIEHTDYLSIGEKTFNWVKIPMIPFKYNAFEIPLLRDTKTLQDNLNEALSDFRNNMQEDPRSTVLVLKNYDGTDIPEFRYNLATYGVVKVTTVDGVQGGVETLKTEVNVANYQGELMQLKRALIENGRGFDAKEERMDGDPNQMNIESMYTDIDLNVNGMERQFKKGFKLLKWFIDRYLEQKYGVNYDDEKVEFSFDRDIFIDEDAKIENCVKSDGILSNKTILSRHPWVSDVARELTQLEEDQKAELDEMQATFAVQNQANPNPDDGGSSPPNKKKTDPKGGKE